MRTNWDTVPICYVWTDLLPIEKGPVEPQHNLSILIGVNKRSDPPGRDQGTPGYENEIFHALDVQSPCLCKGIPTVDMVSDVVFEHLRTYDIFAEAILGKCQKGSLLPPAAVRGPGRTQRRRTVNCNPLG